ncbi:MAG: hypothetical protein OXC65_09170 [Thiotrichales bacterium]|nr:hypothetical protein [Thiotrichales bacterium]
MAQQGLARRGAIGANHMVTDQARPRVLHRPVGDGDEDRVNRAVTDETWQRVGQPSRQRHPPVARETATRCDIARISTSGASDRDDFERMFRLGGNG